MTPPLTATTALTAVWQLRYSTAATAFNCHMAVDELNCYMAVATTAVWQLLQLPYGSCHNCHMAVAITAVWQLPQTPFCRSQVPKFPQQQRWQLFQLCCCHKLPVIVVNYPNCLNSS